MLYLIYHKSFDGVVTIDNSNWYIKRHNKILKSDKQKCVILGILVTIFHCLPCFKPLVTALYSGQAKNYKVCICRLCTKHTSSRDKSKDWLDRIQDNVSEWSDLSNRRRRTSTIKIQICRLI